MPSDKDHTHKYQRIKLGNKGFHVLKCMKPNCTHYIRKELAINLLCECWRCGRDFKLNQQTVQLKKPHCPDCTRPYNFKEVA